MRYLFILFTVLSLSACSYSPEQLRMMYNGMGKAYAKDLKQMADFNDEQRAQLDEFGQQAQQWHRQHRLPSYTTLINRMGTKLQQDGTATHHDIGQFMDMMQGYPHFNEASAVNYRLGKLAQTISTTQRDQIITNLQDEQRTEVTAVRALTPEIRQQSLVKTVDNIMEYLGVELSKSQLDIAREFAPKFHPLGEAHLTAQARWHTQLENLLRQHKQADFPERFAKHMQSDNDSYLLRQQEPELAKANREQAILMIQAINASLDEEQRKTLAETLLSMGETFGGMVE